MNEIGDCHVSKISQTQKDNIACLLSYVGSRHKKHKQKQMNVHGSKWEGRQRKVRVMETWIWSKYTICIYENKIMKCVRKGE
jgi:hypothetical protein